MEGIKSTSIIYANCPETVKVCVDLESPVHHHICSTCVHLESYPIAYRTCYADWPEAVEVSFTYILLSSTEVKSVTRHHHISSMQYTGQSKANSFFSSDYLHSRQHLPLS